jgi:hypothetical protein
MSIDHRRYRLPRYVSGFPRRHQGSLPGFGLAVAVMCALSAGCAHGRTGGSYLPVGASAWYGDHTEDGVTLLLRQEPETTIARVRDALRAAGYSLTDTLGTRRTLRTAARTIGGDTTMVVTAQIIPVELPEPVSSVVLMGTFDVPSRRIRAAPVVQRPGEVHPLYAHLRAIGELLRRSRPPSPW